MQEKKDSGIIMYNAHIVQYYHPGVTRHQSENTRIFLPESHNFIYSL